MVFSSLSFLFVFLPIVIIGYAVLPRFLKNSWLLISSLVFYYLGAGKYILVLLGIIIIAYFSGYVLEKCHLKSKIIIVISIFMMLLIMGYFKYYDFLIENINAIFNTGLKEKKMILPIGLSFFVFQAISYVVDIYRGEKCLTNPIDMALYIAFFPQLIAGPIVRFKDIRSSLVESTKLTFDNLSEGFWRFSIGLCKKVLIANNLAVLSNIVFGVQDIGKHSVFYVWSGAFAYTLQIYYDFSGYSDMAIGLGRIFGFTFSENFNYPYTSLSLKQFWKRWHISLSSFFRDYVYIPLGGSRVGKVRWILNILVVWMLTGIWHGAAWNYVIWGGCYGILLIIEGLLFKKEKDTKTLSVMSVFIHRLFTMLCVVSLWVVFRAGSIKIAKEYLLAMFGCEASGLIGNDFRFQFSNYWFLMLVATIFCFPVVNKVRERIGSKKVYKIICSSALLIGVMLCISFIYMGSYNPFLYFMF